MSGAIRKLCECRGRKQGVGAVGAVITAEVEQGLALGGCDEGDVRNREWHVGVYYEGRGRNREWSM